MSSKTPQKQVQELALYRKYRPKSFKDVVGQEHVTRVLELSLEKGTMAHAYVFAGSRGTGKTSVARIFAESVGAKQHDIYEIDAASNNGVDEIREIREAVHTLPLESPYKVYILDEAHMLSKAAWNALLKTLEEPPKHAMFILATTELEKVPETVLSRCQVFSFKKPSHSMLRGVVEDIAKGEGYSLEKSASELIAFLGDGSFRDTESMLQKILSASKDKTISLEEVELIAGAPKNQLLNDILLGIEEGDSNKALKSIEEARIQNIDSKLLLRLLIERVRTVILLRFAKDLEQKFKENLTDTDFTFLKALADNKGSKITSKTLDELLRAFEETSVGVVKELPLELAILRLSARAI